MKDISFFEEELNLIKDKVLSAMVHDVLNGAPKWFWTEPASLTGKHHPPDDLVEGGLCIHTKKVVWLACRFFEAFDQDTDVGVSAALLHDISQRGSKDEVGTQEDYQNHAHEAWEFLRNYAYEKMGHGLEKHPETIKKWLRAAECVDFHMGRYGYYQGLYGNVDMKLVGLDQQLLHLADVAASFRLLVGLPFYSADIPPLPDIMEAGKHFVERDGELLFNFGKRHYREKAMDVMKKNPGYLRWMLTAGFPPEVVEQVKEIQKEYHHMQSRQVGRIFDEQVG